ncbi:MAG: peptidylprolyl isomerase [Halobacteriales archaeon]
MAVDDGDTVRVHYVGRYEDGGVFDTSREDVARDNDLYDERREYEPLEFTVGGGEVVEGFDEGVVGMEEGETREVTVPPEKGYGEVDDEQLVDYDREEFESAVGEEAERGQHVHAENAHGDVVEVTEDSVTVDYSHELAGETLVFEVEVVEAE